VSHKLKKLVSLSYIDKNLGRTTSQKLTVIVGELKALLIPHWNPYYQCGIQVPYHVIGS